MHKLRSLFLLIAICALPAKAEITSPGSSLPRAGLPMAIGINKSFYKSIRVKVFPHDLKSDWVHGKADDKKSVVLEGEELIVDGKRASRVAVRAAGSGLRVSLDSSPFFEINDFVVSSESPVKVVRKRNIDKSHSYLGRLFVSAKNGGIQIVNALDLETYLKGVVPKESVKTWPIEALKAQAVAARTYATYHLLTSSRRDYDVDDTARFQVYAGHSAREESTDQAVDETRSVIITHKSKVIAAFFHAYSGGRTDSALNIFGNRADYCLGKEEIFSREELKRELRPSSQWIVEWTTDWMEKTELMRKLKQNRYSRDTFAQFSTTESYLLWELELDKYFDSVKTLAFEQDGFKTELNFINIRKVIGWSQFPAYHFRLLSQNEKVAFKGHGWGHHVGLSQWGAFIMAKNYGKTYDEILRHYYTNIKLTYL